MKKNQKLTAIYLTAFPLLNAVALLAADVPVPQVAAKPQAVSATVDNNTDGAFASDLKGAEELLKGLSHERKMTPQQSGEYMAREMERAKKFYAFAKTTLIPHSMSLVGKMKNPDGMIAEGKLMVEKAPDSWQGYDFMATGSLLKRDVDAAKENYEKALKASPDMQKDWYRYMLAACYSAKSDTAKALALYEGIIAANGNWLAVKSSYLGASMLLLGRDNATSSAYFDKGFTLLTPGEQTVLMKSGICDKFRDLEKAPEACSKTNKL